MGELDTDYIFEIPCLARMYYKEVGGSRKLEILNPSRTIQDVDCLVDPGRVPFEARLFAVWENPNERRDWLKLETTEWPNLPSFLKRETIELDDFDLRRAKLYPECRSIFLIDGDTGEERHVFYDADADSWDPKWEGVMSPTMHVRAYWEDQKTYDGEEVDWEDDAHWRPDWVDEREETK